MALGPFHVAQKLSEAQGPRGTAILIRHGETAWNREGRVMGSNEIELDAAGREQIAGTVAFAREIAPQLIFTSPLARARQSAEIIAAGLGGIEVREDRRLSEVMYGRWEGMTYHELVRDPDYLAYRRQPLSSPTPGGETIAQVQARGVAAIMSAIEANHGRRMLFVSHGDIIRTVLCHFIRLQLEHFRRIRVDNATFSAIQIAGDFAEVKFINLLPDPSRAFQTAPFLRKS